jgi:nucleoside-diphosphate-sugar epimerase
MNIFITGATGFLGKRLVSDLLAEGHKLFVLVRQMRKAENLLSSLREDQRRSVYIIEGDITKQQLGISIPTLNELRNNIDAIYHMASYLSFDPGKREETIKINIDGTRRTLDLCQFIGCPKFLYISTAYTLGEDVLGKEALYSLDRSFVNTYEETKCHAEHIVTSYNQKMDVMILRPSIIIGDSVTGKAETSFGMYGLLKSVQLLKRKISRNPEWQKNTYHLLLDRNVTSNLVPVDYVTKVLISALYNGENGKIYNITNPNPPTQDSVFKAIVEVLDFPNIKVKHFKYAGQLNDMEKAFNESLSVFRSYWSRSILFPCENTTELLLRSNKELLNMDYSMLKRIVGGFRNESLVLK